MTAEVHQKEKPIIYIISLAILNREELRKKKKTKSNSLGSLKKEAI